MIMLEIEWIVKAKPNEGQTVEELEQDFDNLVAECLPALMARTRKAMPDATPKADVVVG